MIFLGRNSSNTGVLLILYFFTHVQERNEIYIFSTNVSYRLTLHVLCRAQGSSLSFWLFKLIIHTKHIHPFVRPGSSNSKIKCHQFSSGLRKLVFRSLTKMTLLFFVGENEKSYNRSSSKQFVNISIELYLKCKICQS